MHLHIIGICGTFMGGIAAIAKQLGYQVSGSDANVYPPMSTQLEALGITLQSGYRAENLDNTPDLVIVGNALSRGNPEVERVLRDRLAYTSGAQWLHDNVLRKHWVLAVSGTHGKTTTASMLAWILESAGYNPGFLIGGVPENFGVSARKTDSNFFVIEADEYDTAFFDKRSKFVHYSPDTLIINNLEFDHADIFSDLAAIQKQFSHLLRVVPDSGQIIIPDDDTVIDQVIAKGCWSEVVRVGANADWDYQIEQQDGRCFSVTPKSTGETHRVNWNLLGEHNVANAVMAMLAARHVGIELETSTNILQQFKSPKRRMELLADIEGIKVYDDFAHHPTAIKTTLAGLKAHHEGRIIAVLEPRSNTMKLGSHGDALAQSLAQADISFVLQPESISWSVAEAIPAAVTATSANGLIEKIVPELKPGDAILIMSNGSFDGIHQKLIEQLKQGVRV
ncbi:UDP-N-acetylmuramate:L-alanyl-gamma-D-glutamyl-meso-diaminopimelate ligase [Idiomarina seosinensis]|uniref:UDP-N-acetylmuramate--L-alanyl-gamma-D-glutamyl-meso-2,6-diaminoheptandioate ligase n=1 Tax=Idiomarina seosinensis TaxID=281739 RepID=A0A432ZB30_9GAMM|nr:UDP-N-acetylmuramate:L-alanyl-gamma-D-glutamyl-meso-diaminopimelate ligase [Idiomarina seosinensis]RUO75167.1 UDP-N-acetylmuramate:L-alanyl-gamma-D-glutamyl-meso-diaminopimelate ligase [Idiomarina seosinensis]